MELICLTSVFLLIFLESGDGRWDLREIVICSVYCLIYLTELLQKTIMFSLQCGLVSQNAGLGVIQRFDLADGRFCQSFEIAPLFDDFFLLKTIGELFLSLVELCVVALDEGCRS